MNIPMFISDNNLILVENRHPAWVLTQKRPALNKNKRFSDAILLTNRVYQLQ